MIFLHQQIGAVLGFFKKLKQLAGDSLELCLKKSQHIFKKIKKYQLSPEKTTKDDFTYPTWMIGKNSCLSMFPKL